VHHSFIRARSSQLAAVRSVPFTLVLSFSILELLLQMAKSTAELLRHELCSSATEHKFLASCSDGSITKAQFDTWLVQDFLFVREFTRFAGKVLASSADAHLELLTGGIAALDDELKWFQTLAAQRNVDLARTEQQVGATIFFSATI
jgi:thiaminase